MNAVIRDQWADALESGLYKQGHSNLATDKDGVIHHCCLGVLCELAVLANVIPPAYWDGHVAVYSTAGDEHSGVLPDRVADWAGLTISHEGTDVNPFVTIDDTRYTLSGHNDTGRSFTEIAAAIRRGL